MQVILHATLHADGKKNCALQLMQPLSAHVLVPASAAEKVPLWLNISISMESWCCNMQKQQMCYTADVLHSSCVWN